MRDHGGDLDRAIQEFGEGQWLDLSTGINACPYPVPDLSPRAWFSLPTNAERDALESCAGVQYRTSAAVVALGGAQAAIQLVPRLARPGRACVVGPTYNEHAAALRAQGWAVEMIDDPSQGAGADLVTVVNPNNPDGRRWAPETLMTLRSKVGVLVVDESFADTESGVSIAPEIEAEEERLVVLRSFGKFYGLAGVRLGFSISGQRLAERLRALAGPWSVSGPAIEIGRQALADQGWQEATKDRLTTEVARLDAMAEKAGWGLVGGTCLFRTYATPDAVKAQRQLARSHIWTRIFPYSKSWIRLGLPGTEADWARLEDAFCGMTKANR